MSNSAESVFGKMRGRFDVPRARQIDRSLPDAAMAALVAMPETEWPRFEAMFNRTFRWGETPRSIARRAEA